MTRQGRRAIDPCIVPPAERGGGEVAALLSIFADNIQIFGADTETTPPTFISRVLIERGGVAFLRDVREWAKFNSVGERDRFGLPKRISLVGDRGQLSAPVAVDGDRVCVIPAAPFFNVPAQTVARRVDTLGFISQAIAQNVEALRQIACVKYTNPAMAADVEKAERDRVAGKATTKIYTPMGDDVNVINFSPNAQSHIADLLALYVQTLQELDAAIGRTTVGEKQERRISEEMTVIENSACSAIDVTIDTFNRFCAFYKIDAYMVRGSALNRSKKPQEPQEPQEEEPAGDENEEPAEGEVEA